MKPLLAFVALSSVSLGYLAATTPSLTPEVAHVPAQVHGLEHNIQIVVRSVQGLRCVLATEPSAGCPTS